MKEPESLYRRLQQHLDKMPIGFPATSSGVEIRILGQLFSPEEAELVLGLSALPEPIERIYPRVKKTGKSKEEVEKILDDLDARGLILGPILSDSDKKKQYSKLMLAIGIYERQVDRLTPSLQADFTQYLEEAFKDAFHSKKTSQMRTIPINEEAIRDRRVGTYDDARAILMKSEGPFALINCVCRQGNDLLGKSCKQTKVRETCMVIGKFAQITIRSGHGTEMTREGMLKNLERADDEGMVLQPENTRDPHFICCCCGCCCGVLTSAKQLNRPVDYFHTNYYAEVDCDLCLACGTCSSRCQMDALITDETATTVDLTRCIGCGLCVTTCPSEAIQLLPRTGIQVPPQDQAALYRKITQERFGVWGTMKMLGRRALGMKI